jgi:hypothetical protein
LNLSGGGRKCKTTAYVNRIIQRKTKVDRRKSAFSVKKEIETELGVVIHENTIRNRLYEIALNRRVARKKPYVNKVNRGKGIAYAKLMIEKPFDYWKRVLWSDESMFNRFGSDSKIVV